MGEAMLEEATLLAAGHTPASAGAIAAKLAFPRTRFRRLIGKR